MDRREFIKIAGCIALAVAFIWAIPVSGAEGEFEAAYQIVFNGPLQGDTAGKRIYRLDRMTVPGTVVEGWRSFVTLPEVTGVLFFVDDEPEANWEHPARLVFVNPVDGSFEVYNVRTPPKNFSEFIEIGQYVPKARAAESKAAVPEIKARQQLKLKSSAALEDLHEGEILMSSSDDSSLTLHPDHRFAVLISGGYDQLNNWPRYWNDVAFMYKTLKYKYGYKDKNIYVLFADGLDPAPDDVLGNNSDVDLDGDGRPDIDFSATRKNISKVFAELSERMEAEDLLFVFTTDHGGQTDPDNDPTAACLALWSDTITDTEFAAEVNRIKSYDTMIFVMEQCYSGGFADELKGNNRIFISAAAYDEFSYVMLLSSKGKRWWEDLENSYDEFSYYFTCALAGECPNGEVVRADRDGDEVVSIAEAFSFAAANDSSGETPQFADQSKFADIDPLMGANVVSLDGRFGTSFTFETSEDVINYSIKMRSGLVLGVFIKDAQYTERFDNSYIGWKLTLGNDPRSTCWTSGSTRNWFRPAVTWGGGTRKAMITYLYDDGQLPSMGFVKFVLLGPSQKMMTVTRQP